MGEERIEVDLGPGEPGIDEDIVVCSLLFGFRVSFRVW